MLFLAGSIIFSTLLTIGFKLCQRFGVNTFQAIVANYFTCIVTGFFFGDSHPFYQEVERSAWFPWAMVLGCCFIIFFNLTALTVKRSGVAVAGVATKISLVIPFTFSIFYYNEVAGPLKWLGIVLAIISVVLTCYVPKSVKENTSGALLWLFPFVLFLGTGFQDTMIKFTEHGYLRPAELDAFLVSRFVVAFAIGFIFMISGIALGKLRLQGRALVAGVLIGIPNYFSIWFLVKALKLFPGDSSFVIPVNNIAILLLNALAGFFIFREKLSCINLVGISVAVVAILLITFNMP